MFSFFKPNRIYIKMYTDKIEITDLETGNTISREATEKFSSTRVVVGNFFKAENLMRTIMKELFDRNSFFSPSYKAVIQQMDKIEGGLSDIEIRALRDLAEHAGAKFVQIIDHGRKLSVQEAQLELQKKSSF